MCAWLGVSWNNERNAKEVGLRWLRAASFPRRLRLWRHIILLIVSRLSFGLATDDRDAQLLCFSLVQEGGLCIQLYLSYKWLYLQALVFDFTAGWLRGCRTDLISALFLSVSSFSFFTQWHLKFTKPPPISSKTSIFLHLPALIERAANHIWSGLRFRSYSIKIYLCVIKKPLCASVSHLFFLEQTRTWSFIS